MGTAPGQSRCWANHGRLPVGAETVVPTQPRSYDPAHRSRPIASRGVAVDAVNDLESNHLSLVELSSRWLECDGF